MPNNRTPDPRPRPGARSVGATLRPIAVALAAVLALLVCASPAFAEQVTPNERVTTRLRVRTEPNTHAEAVGYLAPGELAPYVRTAGGWREITFASHPAYVATSYTRIVPDAVAPTPAVAHSIRLGGWNLKKLGHGDSKDYPRVARIIDDNFDVLAVVEVMQKGGGHPGYDSLMAQLGGTWTGQVTATPRPATSSGNAEFYAVIWRTSSSVRPCAGWTALRFHVDNDGGPSGSGPDRFSREPAFGCYEFGPVGAPVADFILAAYHATFQSTAETSAEVGHLGNVFASMQAARPGERDQIIVGDFNRTPPQVASLLPSFADRTDGAGSTLNSAGAVTANLYDHVLVRDAASTSEMQGNARVLDVRSVASSPAAFYKTVSDHLPIVVTMQATADDD